MIRQRLLFAEIVVPVAVSNHPMDADSVVTHCAAKSVAVVVVVAYGSDVAMNYFVQD